MDRPDEQNPMGTCTWKGHGIPRFGIHPHVLGCIDWASIDEIPSVHPLSRRPPDHSGSADSTETSA